VQSSAWCFWLLMVVWSSVRVVERIDVELSWKGWKTGFQSENSLYAEYRLEGSCFLRKIDCRSRIRIEVLRASPASCTYWRGSWYLSSFGTSGMILAFFAFRRILYLPMARRTTKSNDRRWLEPAYCTPGAGHGRSYTVLPETYSCTSG